MSVSEDIRNIMIARSIGDLMTLSGFLTEYSSEINPLIKNYKKRSDIQSMKQELQGLQELQLQGYRHRYSQSPCRKLRHWCK